MLITRAPFSPYILLFPLVVIPLLYLCMRIGLFPFCCECFLSRYSVYLQCHHSSMDVCNPNVLPDRAASGLAQKAGRILYPMFYYIQFFRDLVLYMTILQLQVIFIGCWVMAFIMLSIGLGVFKKTQDNFILYI